MDCGRNFFRLRTKFSRSFHYETGGKDVFLTRKNAKRRGWFVLLKEISRNYLFHAEIKEIRRIFRNHLFYWHPPKIPFLRISVHFCVPFQILFSPFSSFSHSFGITNRCQELSLLSSKKLNHCIKRQL